jgi:hypothetical protein
VCVIVDANLASTAFSSPPHPDFVPVLNWLQEQDGCLVVGGHLARELDRLQIARRFVVALLRAGRARRVPDQRVEQRAGELEAKGMCESNDCHVIGLALASGARTLCTYDKALQRDFRNPAIVSDPRGSIYLRLEHTRLLRHSPSCGLLRRKR